jgi:hypothetical protein
MRILGLEITTGAVFDGQRQLLDRLIQENNELEDLVTDAIEAMFETSPDVGKAFQDKIRARAGMKVALQGARGVEPLEGAHAAA